MIDLTRRQFLGGSAALLAQHKLRMLKPSPLVQACSGLRCEYFEDPVGLDILQPRLGWLMPSSRGNTMQSAYHVLVATDSTKLQADVGDLWDSGKVQSAESIQVQYGGRSLRSREMCHWKVRAWDEADHASAWSAPACWEMGLLESSDWSAQWIGSADSSMESPYTPPSPFFRRLFDVAKPIASARIYVCGLGFFELYLNGAKVGEDVLSPNQTNYDRRPLQHLLYPFDDKSKQRVCYLTYDVAKHLAAGPNAIGMVLGNGWYSQRDRTVEGDMWYGQPKFIAQLEISFVDGTKQCILSDAAWKMTDAGPILHNGIFTGERYDARLEMEGWATVRFDDSLWMQARPAKAPSGRLTAQYSVPDRVTETRAPLAVMQPHTGITRYDFGQNLAGWARIRVTGQRGAVLTLRFFEEGGEGYGQSDKYILKGEGEESYEPRFTWHGFRFVDVEGMGLLKQPPPRIEAQVVHADVEPVGDFNCSNPLFNQILHNYRWAQSSNMHCGVPSDCPHRERVGYAGDGQTSAEAAIFNFDMSRFYTKWMGDIRDAQNSVTGFVPHSAPFEGGGGGPAWGSAIVLIPWLLYVYYGDARILKEHYAGMKQWVAYLRLRTNADGIVVREEPGGWDLGEWSTPTDLKIPPELVNTCYYAYVAQRMSLISSVLGETADADFFNGLANSTAAAFHRRFFDSQRSQYWEGRQGANVFPLAFNTVPAEHKRAVFERLVQIVVDENQTHFDTGMFATRLLLRVLTEGGRADLAYALMNQKSAPSFGRQIAQGATTLWENWNGGESHNHAMFGGVCEWFFQTIAGVNPDPASPGFKHIIVRPQPLADLTFAAAKYRSVHGEIESSWQWHGNAFDLQVRIPGNCQATILVPALDASQVLESGMPVQRREGIKVLRFAEDRLVVRVGTGRYSFSSVYKH